MIILKNMDANTNTIIESLGVYLPPKSVSTSEILEGCKNQIRFPLEKISGIKTRRMAGENEFSIDLAKKAVADCLKKSKYNPADVDLLICCNISRYDAPEKFSFEPCSSVKIRNHFGFTNAIAFDITNACAGMFTGIYIINALLKTKAIRRAMLVSGEYITILTQTAQREIESFMDMRLACLTLGDSGAAFMLENAANTQAGFQEIDLQTFGRYSQYCTANVSEKGGWIMHTDSVNLADAGIRLGAEHSLNVLERAGWLPDKFQHLILHQTSKMTLNSARNEINNLLHGKVLHDENTINNLEERGNTSSTSHFIAIADQIYNNNIQSGDRVIFSIGASGLTVGTALYVFDDLPDRIRESASIQYTRQKEIPVNFADSDTKSFVPRIRIESVGTIPLEAIGKPHSMNLLTKAATSCLSKSSYQSADIGLLIYTGVYRSDYMLEPAYAALLAGELNMNAARSNTENKKTLAFDIFNGSVGFLNACYVAQQIIAGGNCETAMIVASEIENNAESFPSELMGVCETASAIILDAHPSSNTGFSSFLFRYPLAAQNAYTTYCSTAEVKPRLDIEKAADLEEIYIDCIVAVVQEFLEKEGSDFYRFDKILPPQISSGFISKLSNAMNLPREKFIDAVGEGTDLFSSSIPYAVDYAWKNKLVKNGDTGLIIAVGSGIQVGCAIYHF